MATKVTDTESRGGLPPLETEVRVPDTAPGTWQGDWKDLLVEETAVPPYSGDWKDAFVG